MKSIYHAIFEPCLYYPSLFWAQKQIQLKGFLFSKRNPYGLPGDHSIFKNSPEQLSIFPYSMVFFKYIKTASFIKMTQKWGIIARNIYGKSIKSSGFDKSNFAHRKKLWINLDNHTMIWLYN